MDVDRNCLALRTVPGDVKYANECGFCVHAKPEDQWSTDDHSDVWDPGFAHFQGITLNIALELLYETCDQFSLFKCCADIQVSKFVARLILPLKFDHRMLRKRARTSSPECVLAFGDNLRAISSGERSMPGITKKLASGS